jgi:REP element-mobilizing transposase RayT
VNHDAREHQRRSTRLRGYDYSQSGAYFVTVCVQNRQSVFGKVMNGKMILNDTGRMVEGEWLNTPAVRPYVDLDEFVVMPNHFHGIIMIRNEPTIVGATHRVAPTGPTAGSVGAMMAQFKSIATKRMRALGHSSFAWQRNYYEHIVRDEDSLNRIREYILTNPLRWDLDRENPQRKGEDDFDRWFGQLRDQAKRRLWAIRHDPPVGRPAGSPLRMSRNRSEK